MFFFFVVSVLFNLLGGEGEVIVLIDVGEESALWYYSSRKLVKLLIWCFWLFLVVSQQREKDPGWLGGSLRGFPCVFMATVAILELLAHLVWKAKGVTNNKSTNCTALNSMTNTARWEVLRALQVSFHLAPHHGGFRRCGACSPAERGPAGWPSAWQSCTETWAATTLKPS